jgi:hypothetical protein
MVVEVGESEEQQDLIGKTSSQQSFAYLFNWNSPSNFNSFFPYLTLSFMQKSWLDGLKPLTKTSVQINAFEWVLLGLLLNKWSWNHSVFKGFRQAKSTNGSSILSSSQFLILPQLPQKMKLASKVVKVNSKITISLPKI